MLLVPPGMEVVFLRTRQAISSTVVVVVTLLAVLLTLLVTLIETQQSEPGETLSYVVFPVLKQDNTLTHRALGEKGRGALVSGGGTSGPYKPPIFKGGKTGPTGPVAPTPTVAPFYASTPSSPARQTGPVTSGTYVQNAPAPAPINQGSSSAGVGVGSTGIVGGQSLAGSLGGGAVGTSSGPGMSQDQFLAQDATFKDQQSSAQRDFENLMAQLVQQKTNYQLDNSKSLQNLGWQGDQGWNTQDKLTGYGNSFQNQQGDFASRGMLDSSLYGQAQNDLTRGFNQQRDSLDTALQQFLASQSTDQAGATNTRDSAIAAAQRQAIQRYAAQQGLVA